MHFVKLSVSAFLIFYAVLMSTMVFANPFELTIVDSEGQPLENAVISWTSLTRRDAPAEVAIMDQRDKAFDPHVLVVQQGTQVSFPNSDNIRHHVYSFSRPKKFEIKLYSGEPSKPILFDNPGVVVLGCNIHDSMLGYIYVAPDSTYAISNQQGKVQLVLDAEPAAEMLFQIWHPQLNRDNQPESHSFSEMKQNNFTVSLNLTANVVHKKPSDQAESPLEKRFRELRQRREQL